jgi:hypothetical protein
LVLRDVLGRQQGVISWRQAIAAGVTESTIRANVRAGRWRRVLPGVYATFSEPAVAPC